MKELNKQRRNGEGELGVKTKSSTTSDTRGIPGWDKFGQLAEILSRIFKNQKPFLLCCLRKWWRKVIDSNYR